jgi:hypothetical protein
MDANAAHRLARARGPRLHAKRRRTKSGARAGSPPREFAQDAHRQTERAQILDAGAERSVKRVSCKDQVGVAEGTARPREESRDRVTRQLTVFFLDYV